MQRLLAVLAAGRRCAELGTAFGEGAEAIASTATSLVTTELDPERARIARERLAGLPNVEFLEGDWRETLPPRGPFGLVFLDAGGWKDDPSARGQLAIDLLEPGGLLVKDDMTPARSACPRSGPVEGVWGDREVSPAPAIRCASGCSATPTWSRRRS